MRRTTDDRVWVGVAGGVAERMRIDAVLVRAGFVVASAMWGAGLVIYLVLWLVLPELDTPTRNIVRPGARPARYRGAALVAVVLGVLYILRSWSVLPPDRLLLPWLLIMVGVVFLWGRDPVRPLPRPALMPGPANSLLTDIDFEEPKAEESDVAEDDQGSGASPPVDEAESVREEGRVRNDRAGSTPALVPIGTLTIGSLLVVCGMLYLLDDAGVLDVSWRLVGGVGLTVIGCALVAGGWWGRPRGLIVAGSLLCTFLLVATVLQVPIAGGVGRRDYRPVELGDVEQSYEMAVGSVVLDLRDVEFDSRREVAMSVAAGELRVIVPFGVDVDVDARAGFGEVVVFDLAGTGVAVQKDFASDGSAPGQWVLDLDVGIGKVIVEQVR